MRKIFLNIIVCCLLFSSCDSYLELKPQNEVVKEDFWQTQQDVEGVLWSAYRQLQQLNFDIIVMGELRADELALSSTSWEYVRAGLVTPNSSFAKWDAWYKLISYCNVVIANSDDVVERDINFFAEESASLIAEAKAIRALAYFYVARWWKDAPLVVDSYDTDEHSYLIPKSIDLEILNFVYNDLNASVKNLKNLFGEEWELYGRMTQAAGYTILADISLYLEKYDNAIKHCDQVFALRTKSLVDKDDWFTLFSEEFTNESIFELPFDEKYNQKNSIFGLFQGNKPMFRFSSDYHEGTDKLFTNISDVRYEGTYNNTNQRIRKYVTKFNGTDYEVISQDESYANIKLYRLAEVYLIRAEAYAMKNDFNKAREDIKAVADRALPESIVPTFNSVDDALNTILLERRKEFCGEGKLWFDLLRIARKEDWKRKQLIMDIVLSYVKGVDYAKVEAMIQDPYSYYFPIHTSELNNNKALEQNPYYK
ncbi:MAG: RagB/SusD family nutrient uptake outer membrane protein [Carboxylicivirga sp.]|nr:RagB/SusD family nutrient uptake outer membrane protein [Carboxylicivirga sp.]MCT4644565.1 RagB/SusD family nutrient uptake outer membrane protein [Carboxylicivirga sp.]